jgi:Protein of unknown function (DUF4232)
LKTLSLIALLFLAAGAGAFVDATGVAAASASCTRLVVWLNTQGDHTAGSAYYKLEFTNLSGRACALRGYPGVSAVDLGGHQLGSAATRDHSRPARLVRLAAGGTAAAVLQLVDAANFQRSTCHQGKAAGLRVYPPGRRKAKLVPFPFPACSRAGPIYLRVRAVSRPS